MHVLTIFYIFAENWKAWLHYWLFKINCQHQLDCSTTGKMGRKQVWTQNYFCFLFWTVVFVYRRVLFSLGHPTSSLQDTLHLRTNSGICGLLSSGARVRKLYPLTSCKLQIRTDAKCRELDADIRIVLKKGEILNL